VVSVARPSGCRIEIRLDACRPERREFYKIQMLQRKSVETILGAADMNVRATS
jgi:hypothetical protein